MPTATIALKDNTTLKSVIAVAKKLSTEEKQLLKLKVFGRDIITNLKKTESSFKKTKKIVKKSDKEIVGITKRLRAVANV